MRILYGGLKYDGLNNLGDQIQSIAAERFLPNIDKRFNRDELANYYESKTYALIMNGWFTHNPSSCFPPNKNFLPIYWGFHITDWNDSWDHFLSEGSLNHLKLNGPIGCRDNYTAERLKSNGVEAFNSKCLTLTFPKRCSHPSNNWNIIVDVPFPLPKFIETNGLRTTHIVEPTFSAKVKLNQARKLLNLYELSGGLIITTRLHCALPCIAMGIPVIFFGNFDDYRTSIIRDLGIPIYKIPSFKGKAKDEYIDEIQKLYRLVNWYPAAIDIEIWKKKTIDQFISFLNRRIR
tara:strand:+ start:438 stop:1310 length:873 start_codon:yes stop_codon:yes gene_type:complete